MKKQICKPGLVDRHAHIHHASLGNHAGKPHISDEQPQGYQTHKLPFQSHRTQPQQHEQHADHKRNNRHAMRHQLIRIIHGIIAPQSLAKHILQMQPRRPKCPKNQRDKCPGTLQTSHRIAGTCFRGQCEPNPAKKSNLIEIQKMKDQNGKQHIHIGKIRKANRKKIHPSMLRGIKSGKIKPLLTQPDNGNTGVEIRQNIPRLHKKNQAASDPEQPIVQNAFPLWRVSR